MAAWIDPGGDPLRSSTAAAMLMSRLLELLPSPEHQWSVILAGLCINFALVIVLRTTSDARDNAEAKKPSCSPAAASRGTAAAHVTAAVDIPRAASDLGCGTCFGDLFCFAARSASLPSEASPVSNEEPPWLLDDELLHPRYCGARLQRPGSIPVLHRFALDPLGFGVPSHWEYLLPGCSDVERSRCRQLRTRISDMASAKDPVTMIRFLRARKGSVDAAADMYRKAMSWRESVKWEHRWRANTKCDMLHKRVDSFWPPSALLGTDLDDDPIYYLRPGLISMDFLEQVPLDFLVQHEVYVITRIMQAMEELSRNKQKPVMQMTVVVDCADLSTKLLNIKGITKYKACVRTMEDNFPEIVKRVVVVRAPRIAYVLWNLVSRFFDEGTRDKIQIADSQRTIEVLSSFIDPKWVPEALGGQHRIGSSGWCHPCIPTKGGCPNPQVMRDIAAAYPDPPQT